jgi:hypothetical protein
MRKREGKEETTFVTLRFRRRRGGRGGGEKEQGDAPRKIAQR